MTDLEKLRGFANYLMEALADTYTVDTGDIQDAAVEFGLLQAFEVSASCGDACVCVEYGAFPQICYRKTAVLAGDNDLAMAHRGADAACCLDALKNIHAPDERTYAEAHVTALHDIAQQLAADRADEVYAPDDEEPASIEHHIEEGRI